MKIAPSKKDGAIFISSQLRRYRWAGPIAVMR